MADATWRAEISANQIKTSVAFLKSELE
jgi:hypothetical protein